MVRPREFDEQQALAAAIEVFWEKGYEATSISDLTSRMGIQRPSLYAAFGGKKELFETALTKYASMSFSYIQHGMRNASTVKIAFQGYFEGIIQGAGGGKPDFGCLCVNTMVELAPHDQSFARFTNDFQKKLAVLFQQTLEDGIRTGELSNGLNAVAIARALSVSAVGLSVTMKTKPDREFAENAMTEILTLLD